jgi:formylglycine-generating enzyme required for sulfatase activity
MRAKVEASGLPWKVRDRATGVELVLIMPSSFSMGSPDDEEGRKAHEGPQHQVRSGVAERRIGRFGDDVVPPPNAWGLHEMQGNMWEWTADAYRPDAYAGRDGLTTDPFVATATPMMYVLRGGSWYDGALDCRAAARDSGGYDVRSNRIGFRVARTAGPA